MPSSSSISGYTFLNWGPVTTTFTAPASCATDSDRINVGANSSPPNFEYGLQCSTVGGWDCVPTGTKDPTTTQDMNPTLMYQRSYYSPGLYCPSGWATVGVAVRDDENSLSKSGILAPASTTTTSEPDYALISPKDFFLSLLEPSETAVLCCPSSYTADLDFGCWTKIPDYKPSSGCNYHIPAKDFLNFVTVTKVIDGETVTTEYMESLTATNPFGEPKTTTFDDEEKATLAGYDSYAIMTMVHKKADFEEAGPTNAAQRMTPGSSTWTGFGTVLGVSVAAMALGAAIIL